MYFSSTPTRSMLFPPLQKSRPPRSQLAHKAVIPLCDDAHRYHTLWSHPTRRHEPGHVIQQMARNSFCQHTGIDLFRHCGGVRAQRRVDRRRGECCYLRCDRFKGLDRKSEDGGYVAGRDGRGRGKRRWCTHTGGWVRQGRKRGTKAKYCGWFFVGEPISGKVPTGVRSLSCLLQG